MEETKEIVKADEGRAQTVKQEIMRIKDAIEDNVFDLGDLLLETIEKDYCKTWGFARFSDWLTLESGLDMGERQAYYLANLMKKSRELGLSRDELKRVKISKLKEIFSLDPAQYGEQMKQLVGEAATDSLEEVRNKVQAVKAKEEGHEPFTYYNIRVTRRVKEEIIEPAFELVRRQYGNMRDEQGNVIEINDAKCLELVSVDYMQDPNHYAEQTEP